MAKTIVIANQKGGVGKTTTTINVGALLAELNKKTLLIDIDPQGNTGSGLNANVMSFKKTIYQLLLGTAEFQEVVVKTKIPYLDLLPSNIDLSGLEIDLKDDPQKEFCLKNIIQNLKSSYDYILIDSPPSLGLLTINALVASDSVMVPLQCEYFALEGLTQLLRIISLTQKELNTSLELEGVLLTMYDSRTKLSSQVVQDVREHFGDQVFEIIIPRNVKLSEAPSFGEPINIYEPNSLGSIAYQKLVKELINKNNDKEKKYSIS